MCLDARENSKVYLEFLGDVAGESESVEVKHHVGKHYITSNSVDVWKTLRNHVRDFERLRPFEKLVLLTTSTVREDSIFYGWNELSSSEKMARVTSHTASDGVERLFNEVCSFDVGSLELILNRFVIVSDQPKVDQMWLELAQHSRFFLVSKKLRRDAVTVLLGYLERVVVFSEVWEVDINDFHDASLGLLQPYTSGQIPFPVFSYDKDVSKEDINGLVFVEKMRAVKLKDREQHAAFASYVRALQSEQRMLADSPVIIGAIARYTSNVKEHIELIKSKYSYSLDLSKLDTDVAHAASRDAYFESMSSAHEQISGVSGTEKYFRDGKIHQVVNDCEFFWKYREDDL